MYVLVKTFSNSIFHTENLKRESREGKKGLGQVVGGRTYFRDQVPESIRMGVGQRHVPGRKPGFGLLRVQAAEVGHERVGGDSATGLPPLH
jgi:hypothetical protein